MSYSRPDKNLNGLSGWLLLVGLGLVLSPFKIVASSAFYVDLFQEGGTWDLITSKDSPVYNPGLAAFIGGELFFNALIFIGAIALIGLFFAKHHLFPRVFIAYTLLNAVIYFIDGWAASQWLPGNSMKDWEFAKGAIPVLASAFIWVPYMIVSERVSQTFITGRKEDGIAAADTASQAIG